MIDISLFKKFLTNNFDTAIIQIEEFKDNLQFVEIDCLTENRKLIVEISDEAIKVSTISKEAVLDFSLYDYSFNNNQEAEALILEIKKQKYLPRAIGSV